MFLGFLKIYLCLAALALHCCTWAFSSCGEWGLLFTVGFSLQQLLSLGNTGSRVLGPQQLQHLGPGVGCMGLVTPMPIKSSQTRDLGPLHWQVDSKPLNHQGSPGVTFYLVEIFRISSLEGSISSNPERTEWGARILQEFSNKRAGALNVKRLLLFKENQIHQGI